MPLNAPEITPLPVEGLTVSETGYTVERDGQAGIAVTTRAQDALASAPTVDPKPISGISATALPPVAAAGVRLTQWVLFIAAGSIVGLVAYLFLMDIIVGADVGNSYKAVLNPSRLGTEFYTLGRLEKFSVDLSGAAADPNARLDVEATKNAEGIMTMLAQMPSVTNMQVRKLKECVPLPVGPSRGDTVQRCVAVLDQVRQAALEAAAGATDAEVAGDAVDKLNTGRQTFHTFWLQAAQLILLNLLLPLLTALLGYVFGTQQAQRSSG